MSRPTSAGARQGVERLRGARVAVWGTGAEGRSAAELARRHGAEVTVVDDLAATGVLAPAVLAEGGFDVVVRSPGVSRYRPELEAAARAGAVVTTLTALWLEDFAGAPVLAVTGSKGKTTTAVLAAAALRATGRTVALAGNMGRPLAELYDPAPGQPAPDAYVLEVSSFQAADVTVSPPVGVLTLLAPDHLDWHGSYERYVADKCNLFAHRAGMVVAVNATDPPAWAATGGLPGRVGYGAPGSAVAVGRDPLAAGAPAGRRPGDDAPGGVDGGVPDLVLVDGTPYVTAHQLAGSRLAVRGAHNLVNLCGALTAVRALAGALPEAGALVAELDATEPLGSRLRTVARAGGVEFVDDALASNPAGAVAGLRAFAGRPLCLLAGGADRGVALDPLVAELRRRVPPASVVVLDEAGARLAAELGPGAPCRAAASVGEAVRLAVAALGGPGVVLFSPGAPTPPAQGSYVQRSAAFAEAAGAEAARLDGGEGKAC